MSFWQIDVNPFISIVGSALVSWAVVAASRKQARQAEEWTPNVARRTSTGAWKNNARSSKT